MRDPLSLHEELCSLLGSRYAYFQPPSSTKMRYPCIVYKKLRRERVGADNAKYLSSQSYQVTVIYTDPDCDLPDKILDHFQFISQDTDTYVVDSLYHDVFTLYY